jgi:hypothetical protein
MGGRIPREQVVESLLRHARAIHQEQKLRAEMAYPQVHRMDTPRDEIMMSSGSGPPPPPPPGMGEILASHNQMRAQMAQMAHHVHETSNRAMQLEQRLMSQERARERSREEKRHATAAMVRREYDAQAAAPPFLNQIIGAPAVPAPPAPPPDAGVSSGVQEKRESSAAPEQRSKTQVVERVVEKLIERPADITRPGIPDPPPPAPIRYDPPKALSEVMPYTHASDPALARAVAHVVAAIGGAPKRAAEDPGIEEATQAADQSGSKPIVAKKMRAEAVTPARVKKPTRYTTMSKFNAAQIVQRRERRKALEERRSEREAVRIAKEEAMKAIGRVISKTKTKKPKAPGARMTPGRRAVVVV